MPSRRKLFAYQASLAGLEPAISTVTGWRALQLLRKDKLFLFQWLEWDSNPQHLWV